MLHSKMTYDLTDSFNDSGLYTKLFKLVHRLVHVRTVDLKEIIGKFNHEENLTTGCPTNPQIPSHVQRKYLRGSSMRRTYSCC